MKDDTNAELERGQDADPSVLVETDPHDEAWSPARGLDDLNTVVRDVLTGGDVIVGGVHLFI
ncbi:MAG: hypothetical protein KC619_05995 [Myxococcales bacterium]|nr:hypothetical protein [Myxococcales bacterium]